MVKESTSRSAAALSADVEGPALCSSASSSTSSPHDRLVSVAGGPLSAAAVELSVATEFVSAIAARWDRRRKVNGGIGELGTVERAPHSAFTYMQEVDVELTPTLNS